MTASLGKLITEHQQQQLRVGTLRELAMAHQAYMRSVTEFGGALGIELDELNGAQADAIFSLCNTIDPREVSDETLISLMRQLEELK